MITNLEAKSVATLRRIFGVISFVLAIVILFSEVELRAHPGKGERNEGSRGEKIGVLLVSHGSRSDAWRKSLLALEASVRESLLSIQNVRTIKSAFMEYEGPSIATQLREFDAEGFTDIIIIPVFLTVSPHSFDDIPTIIGKKEDPNSVQTLKVEQIERYTPRARTHITPLLDFSDMLRKNVLRRAKALSQNAGEEGLVMIAYGDETYKREWSELLSSVGEFVKQRSGILEYSFGWCGHLVHYDPQFTASAIEQVLAKRKKAIVIPVLVAPDEMFQVRIIGDGIAKVKENKTRVRYKPDSILPDRNVESWIVQVTTEFATDIRTTR